MKNRGILNILCEAWWLESWTDPAVMPTVLAVGGRLEQQRGSYWAESVEGVAHHPEHRNLEHSSSYD